LFCLAAGSTFPGRTTTAWRPSAHPAGTQLLDLVPADSLAAIQIRDLDRRWAEIRNNSAIAQLQDYLLHEIGIEPDRVPVLAASHAVLMLARSESEPFIVPVALLRPCDRAEALRVLAGSRKLSYRDGRDVLWVGPEAAGGLLDSLARGTQRSLSEVLPIEEIDARLPGKGLLRGYVNPRAWAELLAQWSNQTNLELPRWIAAWLGAELSALRYVAFDRDFVAGEIETKAVAAYDTARLPAEVAGIFVTNRPPIPAAPLAPPGTIATFSFRLEAAAWLPWLRHLAARDPHGPLRNLDFWFKEFEVRYHRDLRRDLCAALGENGWLFLVEGERTGSAAAVALIETSPDPAEDLKETLADLLEWMGEGVWIDSLGTLFPRYWTGMEDGIATRGMDFWTPIGRRLGLCFAVGGKYLVLATDDSALHEGLTVAQNLPNMRITTNASATHAAVRLRGDAIARMFSSCLVLAARQDDPLLAAVSRLLAGIDCISLDMSYEPDGMRLEGYVRFATQP
jgi:hypothetical protein